MTRFVKDMLMSKYGKGDKHYEPHHYPEHEPDYRRSSRYDSSEYDYGRNHPIYNGQGYANQVADYERGQQYHDYRKYDMSRDYGHTEYGKMSREDIERWCESLENNDGTRGKHFKKDQVEHAVKQSGIDVHRFGGMEVFCMTMNMMYADYCTVAKKFGADTPVFYAEMAKAFLEDKDFRGSGEEKLWLYYKCIAEQED